MGAEPDTPGTTCGSGAADGDLRRYPAERVRAHPPVNQAFANPAPHGARVAGRPARSDRTGDVQRPQSQEGEARKSDWVTIPSKLPR